MIITVRGFVADEPKALALKTNDVSLVPNVDVPRAVAFLLQPTGFGPATTAILDDTCGYLIQIVSMNRTSACRGCGAGQPQVIRIWCI